MSGAGARDTNCWRGGSHVLREGNLTGLRCWKNSTILCSLGRLGSRPSRDFLFPRPPTFTARQWWDWLFSTSHRCSEHLSLAIYLVGSGKMRRGGNTPFGLGLRLRLSQSLRLSLSLRSFTRPRRSTSRSTRLFRSSARLLSFGSWGNRSRLAGRASWRMLLLSLRL